MGDYVIDYIARLVRATRPSDPTAPDFIKKMVDYGAGPRAGQFLRDGGKALAAMDGRFSVAIDDIKKVAIPVLRHRLSTNFQAQAEGKKSEDIIQQLLATIGEPEIGKYENAPPLTPRSQAPPGNALLARLCLASRRRARGGASQTVRSQAEPGNENVYHPAAKVLE